VTWWCSAQDVAWTWSWQAYPGVWLFVAMLVGLYIMAIVRLGPRHATSSGRAWYPWHLAYFGLGITALWIATDWPLGALGAGYLLSVHTVQYLLYTFVAPPLILLGLPRWLPLVLERRPVLWRVLRMLARPIVALLIVDAVLLVSHLPPVVDGFRRSQFGSFTIDLVWLLAGLIMWWPVMAPRPETGRLSEPWKIGYLFITTIVPTVPAAFFAFSNFPIYALYELAPRVGGIASGADQQAAGLLMKAGDPIVWLAMLMVFIRWSMREAEVDKLELAEHRRAAAGGGSQLG
jgi:putative membrane protein